MNISNDVLLILLVSILSTQPNEDGEVDFANNTNFLLLLLLVLNSSRTLENLCNTGSCNGNSCNNGCNNGCNSCSGNFFSI